MALVGALSTWTSENVVEIVGEKEEAVGLYLILEELSSRIVCHGESGGIAPFEEARFHRPNRSWFNLKTRMVLFVHVAETTESGLGLHHASTTIDAFHTRLP